MKTERQSFGSFKIESMPNHLDLREKKKPMVIDYRKISGGIFQFIGVLTLVYFLVGAVRILAVDNGEAVEPISFLDAPWRLLLNLIQ